MDPPPQNKGHSKVGQCHVPGRTTACPGWENGLSKRGQRALQERTTDCDRADRVWSWREETVLRRGSVVDPGADLDDIVALIEKLGGTLEKILVTHGHTDHAGGVSLLAKRSASRSRLKTAELPWHAMQK